MSEEVKVEDKPKVESNQAYPPMIATNAVLQYLREIFMALDNISFQIRTTMNSIISQNKDDVSQFTVNNPNEEGNEDPIIKGVDNDNEE